MPALAPAVTADAGPRSDSSAGAAPDRVDAAVVAVFDSLAAAAPAWTRLERIAPATPYGQLAWAEAWCATVGAARGERPIVAAVFDRESRPVALFPFVRRSTLGVRTASFIGGKDSNGNLALFAEPERWGAAALTAVLRTVARQAGVDLFTLRNQPPAWCGRPNPFVHLPHQPSPSGVAASDLRVGSTLSKQARKRLRQKTGWLEAIGPVSLFQAAIAAEVDCVLEAHAAQRAARAETAGVPRPSAAQMSFYRAAAAPRGAGAAPVELFALRCGNEIVATFGGTGTQDRYSGMILSVDARPAVARCSPGELLLRQLMPALAARGFARFDLGIGEARYKASFCEEQEPLIDCFVPFTMRGRIAAVGLAAATRLKRRVKASGPAMARVRRLAAAAR